MIALDGVVDGASRVGGLTSADPVFLQGVLPSEGGIRTDANAQVLGSGLDVDVRNVRDSVQNEAPQLEDTFVPKRDGHRLS